MGRPVGIFGYDPVPEDRLAPAWCPDCLLTPTEQVPASEVQRLAPGTLCHSGTCAVRGIFWVTKSDGAPTFPLFPAWDTERE